MKGKVSVIIADDHDVVIRGLRAVLDAEGGFEVLEQANDGLTALRLVERLKPNVLVVDMMMPGINGLEITRQVTRRCPEVNVVMLSMHDNEAYVTEALVAGAKAYVLKASDAEELLLAIREAAAGRRYLSRALSDRAIEAFVERARDSQQEASSISPLTEREREVLQLVAESRSSAQIAGALGISPRTAETHRSNMMRKLGLHNQTDVIRYAVQQGYITLS
jgi:DNA-binding NarL/FixJ family response regulator